MRLTSGAAGSGACTQAGHRGHHTLSALQAALQHGLHALVFSCIFSVLDTLRRDLTGLWWGTGKFTTLEEGEAKDRGLRFLTN